MNVHFVNMQFSGKLSMYFYIYALFDRHNSSPYAT